MKNILIKRAVRTLLSLFILITVFIGCGNRKHKKNASSTNLYSNILDKKEQEEVKDAMQKAGISLKNISSFLQNVEQFNEAIEGEDLVNRGFVEMKTPLPDYDELHMQEKWDNKHPDFPGFNCRITAYDLLRDFIKVENPSDTIPLSLIFDEEALENCGRPIFSSEERGSFRKFFTSVPTGYDKNIETHLKNIQDFWKKEGISFVYPKDSSKASLISVVMHSSPVPEESSLFIGHSGVLLPFGKRLLFIEKLTFHLPYQAIIFNNRIELNDYLMRQYDIEWNQPTASPFIMENDELLEGYRPNPYKAERH